MEIYCILYMGNGKNGDLQNLYRIENKTVERRGFF